MERIKKCPRCGKKTFGQVVCEGYKEYRYEVECMYCSLSWITSKYTSGVQAKFYGIEEWNGIYKNIQ